jgi:hypothetical protein
MASNFNFAVSAKLDPDTVKAMLKQVIEEQTGIPVKSIEFDVSRELACYGTMDHYELVFKGINVKFGSETSK